MRRAKKGAPELPRPLPSLLVLVGDDEVQRDEWLERIRAALGKERDETRCERVPGASLDEERARLRADLAAPALFGGAKLVVVRDGVEWLGRSTAWAEPLLRLPPGNHVVFCCAKLDGRTRFAKQVSAAGGLLKCERPRERPGAAPPDADSPPVRSAREQARRLGLDITPDAAVELVGRIGGDTLTLRQELAKLDLYLGGAGGKVTRGDVEAVVPRSAAWDRFRLFDEIARGDVASALRRVEGMLREGSLDRSGRRVRDPRASAAALVAMLSQRVRQLLTLRAMRSEGAGREALLRALGVRNPGQLYYLEKEAALPLLRQGGRALDALLAADRALKASGRPDVVLAALVVRLGGLARERTEAVP